MKNYWLIFIIMFGSISSLYAGDLRRATTSGSLEEVKKVLDNLESDTEEYDLDFQPSFFIAVQKGFLDILKELLRYGADINNTDDRGRSAIFLANKEKQIEVMKIIREWSIKNQQRLPKKDIELIAQAGIGTIRSYSNDFEDNSFSNIIIRKRLQRRHSW